MRLPEDFLGRVVFIIQNYGGSLLKGAGTTILIALVGTVIGCLIGLIVGIIQTIPVRKKDNLLRKIVIRTLKLIMNIYVEVFRGTPMMVQAMFIYYGSALLFGINMEMWFAAFFIVSINTGAYMAETVRGGIGSIDLGQREGAWAMGMSPMKTMIYIVLPQAFKNIIPEMANTFLTNLKMTSVLNVIAVQELFMAAKTVGGNYYKYFESYLVIAVIYFVLCFVFNKIFNFMEKKLKGKKDYALAVEYMDKQ
jgi:putative lysine transport system permease protein